MKPDPKRIRELFVAAVGQVDPRRGEALLEDECGGDPELLGEVRLLLEANREAGSFLKRPAGEIAGRGESRTSPGDETRSAETAALPGPGTVVGPYEILQPIGALETLAESIGPVPRVLLRDTEAEHDGLVV
jgi:hypothetical protein